MLQGSIEINGGIRREMRNAMRKRKFTNPDQLAFDFGELTDVCEDATHSKPAVRKKSAAGNVDDHPGYRNEPDDCGDVVFPCK